MGARFGRVLTFFLALDTRNQMMTFLSAATLGRGSVIMLPEDVRRAIAAHTYPRAVLWCGMCGLELLMRAADGSYEFTNTHPIMWTDVPKCASCYVAPDGSATPE